MRGHGGPLLVLGGRGAAVGLEPLGRVLLQELLDRRKVVALRRRNRVAYSVKSTNVYGRRWKW